MAQHFIDARLADLTVAQSLFTKTLQEKAVPAWEDVPLNVMYTTLAAAVLVQLLVAMLSRRGRRIIFDTVETVLAVILIVVLLAVVIGLPIGIVYLTLKAASFLVGVLMGVPLIASLVGTVTSALGL